MPRVLLLLALPFLLTPIGCGPPAKHPVKGTVKLDGKPLPHCKVILFPDVDEVNPDKHGFGAGVTNEVGEFEIQHPQGDKGIQSGRYKVFFEAMVDGKGKPLPANTKPSEVAGGVKNLLPDRYGAPSTTPERLDVGSGGIVKEFNLSSK